MNCPKCGYVMSDFDEACPRCQRLGAQAAPAPFVPPAPARPTPPAPSTADKQAAAAGGCLGGCMGASFGIWFVLIGIALCFIPVIGWIMGAGMIIAGILLPFLGPLIGAGAGINAKRKDQ